MHRRLVFAAFGANAVAGFSAGTPLHVSARHSTPQMNLHDYTCKTLAGEECKMESFKGKPTLILNVASL